MWPFDLLFPLAVVTSPQPPPQMRNFTRPDQQSQYLPVVTMHGINDDHKSCLGLISTIKESMPGVHVVNLVLGESRQKERDHSIYMGMEEQVARIEIMFSSSPNPHPMMSRWNGPAGW